MAVLVVTLVPRWTTPLARAALAAAGAAVALAVNAVAVTPPLHDFNSEYRAAMVQTAGFLKQHCTGAGPVLVVWDVGVLAGEGVGRCAPIVDAATLADPQLRGTTVSQKIARVRPEFLVQSQGAVPDEWAGGPDGLVPVASRPYAGHGVSSAGDRLWVTVCRVPR